MWCFNSQKEPGNPILMKGSQTTDPGSVVQKFSRLKVKDETLNLLQLYDRFRYEDDFVTTDSPENNKFIVQVMLLCQIQK